MNIFKNKEESGQSLVEFALVLPILLLLLGLIFDLGRAVHIKSNLQYLAGEAQKVTTLFEEGGVKGGIRVGSQYGNANGAIKHILEQNKSLDKDILKMSTQRSPVEVREFTRKHYDNRTGQFLAVNNTNEVQYLTVTFSYEMEYQLFMTRAILGDSIKLSESYTGMIYLGSDGK